MNDETQDKPRYAPSDATMRLAERALAFEDETEPWLRGVITTEIWRDHPDMPLVAKRAEATARSLEEIEPIVLPEDAIIGLTFRRLRTHHGVGNKDIWRLNAKDPEMRGYREGMPVPSGVDRTLQWWRGKPDGYGAIANKKRDAAPWIRRYAIANPNGRIGGHTLPDHAILLENGIGGLRRQIAERLQRPTDARQRDQLGAMDRILEALSTHAHKCADAARRKASEIDNAELRRGLEGAARRCEAIADGPPRTFAQALQLLFFSNCADILGNHSDAASFGRIDQILYPFYRADTDAGRLTPEQAFDLICRFVVKKWQVQSSNNMTLGGVTADGRDATNDLSFLFLEAMEATKMPTDISARVHAASPEAFLRTVARVMRCGMGRPSLYSDDAVIPALVDKGIALEDARDYAPLGCVEVMIPGRSSYRTMCMALSPVKVLELVLHGGRCAVTGDTVWQDAPQDFPTFDALRTEVRRRIRQIVDIGVEIIREDERLEPDLCPRPWLSVLSRGAIDDARDMSDGQTKYDPVGVPIEGLADLANSLAAIERLVYREKRLGLDELRTILLADWEGHETLRRHVVNDLPRFGHDAPDANCIAAKEAHHYAACFEHHRTLHGDRFWPMIFGVSSGMVHGRAPRTGATASGRRTGEELAMSLQPSPTGPQGCVTSLMRACTAIDFRDFPGGVSNVQDIDPSHVAGTEGLDRLTQMLGAFRQMGGMEISLNFLDEAKLREAAARPEQYQHLMVRLFGLSARYVDLDDAMQHHVIERVRASVRPAG